MHAASCLRPLLRAIIRARVTVPSSFGDHPPLLGRYRSFFKVRFIARWWWITLALGACFTQSGMG